MLICKNKKIINCLKKKRTKSTQKRTTDNWWKNGLSVENSHIWSPYLNPTRHYLGSKSITPQLLFHCYVSPWTFWKYSLLIPVDMRFTSAADWIFKLFLLQQFKVTFSKFLHWQHFSIFTLFSLICAFVWSKI